MSTTPDDSSLSFAPEDASPTHWGNAAPWKVMIVDDEPTVHDVTRLALTNSGLLDFQKGHCALGDGLNSTGTIGIAAGASVGLDAGSFVFGPGHTFTGVGALNIGASLLTAAIVAHAGPIGFVGLVVPHALRLIIGADQRLLFPASLMVGGATKVGKLITMRR